jgi:hypothetical protein
MTETAQQALERVLFELGNNKAFEDSKVILASLHTAGFKIVDERTTLPPPGCYGVRR